MVRAPLGDVILLVEVMRDRQQKQTLVGRSRRQSILLESEHDSTLIQSVRTVALAASGNGYNPRLPADIAAFYRCLRQNPWPRSAAHGAVRHAA
jgi:hypothetical protein